MDSTWRYGDPRAGRGRAQPLLEKLVGRRAGDVLQLLDRFDVAHPREEPHYYLSLLGTHPAHAGRGLGIALLAENLARIDGERMPAYLESSNPGNNHRYERFGCRMIGESTHQPATHP